MIGELNKIFDRNFVIGYFMPALAFLAATIGILYSFGMLPDWLSLEKQDVLKETTIFALLSWVLGILLLLFNRVIFRVAEGYWYFRSYLPLTWIQQWRFRRLHGDLSKLKAKYDAWPDHAGEFPERAKLQELMLRAANQFPAAEALVLPTTFGNVVRAFEDYPRVVYGIESIQGWSRLLAVTPKEYREIIDSARATTDCWINLWFVSLVFLLEYATIAIGGRAILVPWVVPAAIVLATAAYLRARSSADAWGECVKASFDIFLPDLCAKLGLKLPSTPAEQRKMWQTFSQTILYRDLTSRGRLTTFMLEPRQDLGQTSDGSSPSAAVLPATTADQAGACPHEPRKRK